ncbi:alpha/beta hydrolase fold domain-containing protein [Paenibacillus allorhizosphaerae]|uniref:Acetyl esterase n=1 Tax=Paenibacillus allorhizosphaerae TaxID=2849866 RepID=A0ABM8VJ54_9BACL|nr:alpha/beta hydrolase [Paenibacillus allorhizosphaerae]CAG7644377.1 Acetyl esterase [Paenibacillus allorhizosphaerae]
MGMFVMLAAVLNVTGCSPREKEQLSAEPAFAPALSEARGLPGEAPVLAQPAVSVAPKGVKLFEDVEIGMAGSRKLYTSIAIPDTPPESPLPVMVYIHGGGWNHGNRKDALRSISGYVTKRGYIGVSLEYRLTPEAAFPAQIQDVKLEIRYLRAHAKQYHLDPSRIGVWGVSAGGHLASLLGTTGDLTPDAEVTLDNGKKVKDIDLGGSSGWQQYSDQVQAVADWYGPADFTTPEADKYKSLTALLGNKSALSVPDLARLAMPGTYASPSTPPFWIRHGDADTTIPFSNSEKFAKQLEDAGAPVVDFKIVPGQGHGFKGEEAAQASEEAWAFMDKYVKNRVVTEPILFKK